MFIWQQNLPIFELKFLRSKPCGEWHYVWLGILMLGMLMYLNGTLIIADPWTKFIVSLDLSSNLHFSCPSRLSLFRSSPSSPTDHGMTWFSWRSNLLSPGERPTAGLHSHAMAPCMHPLLATSTNPHCSSNTTKSATSLWIANKLFRIPCIIWLVPHFLVLMFFSFLCKVALSSIWYVRFFMHDSIPSWIVTLEMQIDAVRLGFACLHIA